MSFRTRLSLTMGAFVLALVTLTSFAIYRVVDRNLHEQVDDFLRDRVESVSARLNEQRRDLLRGIRVRNPLGEALLDTRFDVVSQVISPTGEVLFLVGENDIPVTPSDVAVATGANPQFRDFTLDDRLYRIYVVPIQGGGALQLARDIDEISEALASIRAWLFGVGLTLVALATFVSWWVARLVTDPLRVLSRSANDIATTGSLDTTIAEAGAAEVRSLARSLNTMLQRIKESFDRERQFVQDASHELRTPLTSLRVNTELLERPEIGDIERGRILSDIRSEVDALTSISGELATLAVDQRNTEELLDVGLADATAVVVERVRRRTARVVNLETSDHASPPAVVALRLSQFERALGNLLDNAVKFSPAESSVDVRVSGASVAVIDHGPGVGDDEKQKVFTRFYRSAATRAMPGSGLGLAIVEQFARDHDATVRVTDTPGGGATFTLRFSRGAEGN
jgi:two-component system, OmpR family, sensor histidine kinase MprB